MRILELFSGTGIFSEIARSRGHETVTVDLYEPADIQADVRTLTPRELGYFDMVWASPPCKNGDSCHIAAPRGSKTGTQGIVGARDRGKLPKELCIEVLETMEGYESTSKVIASH